MTTCFGLKAFRLSNLGKSYVPHGYMVQPKHQSIGGEADVGGLRPESDKDLFNFLFLLFFWLCVPSMNLSREDGNV